MNLKIQIKLKMKDLLKKRKAKILVIFGFIQLINGGRNINIIFCFNLRFHLNGCL